MSNVTSLLIPYMYTPDWWALHVDTPESYTSGAYDGEYFLDIQDARDIYYLLKSADSRSAIRRLRWRLNAALRSIKAKTLFIGNPQDQVRFRSMSSGR